MINLINAVMSIFILALIMLEQVDWSMWYVAIPEVITLFVFASIVAGSWLWDFINIEKLS